MRSMASPEGETQLPARRPGRAVPALQIAPQALVAAAPPADAGFVGEAIDVRKVLGVLRRNLWLILAITAVTVGLAWYLASQAEPEYRAKVVLRFKDQRQALTGGIADATVEKALGVTADPFLSQIQLLNSRKLIGAVVDREHLRLRLSGHGRAPGLLRVFALDAQAPVATLTLRFLENEYIVDPGKGHVRAPYGQPVEIAGARFSVMYRPAVETALLQVQSRGAAIDRVSRSLRA